MQNLKSSFASFSALFLLVALSATSYAQNATVVMNMSVVSSSMMYNSAKTKAATTSIMLMDAQPDYPTVAPANSMKFTATPKEPKFKPVSVSLSKSKRATLKLHNVEAIKPASITSNKPFRFSALIMTVKF